MNSDQRLVPPHLLMDYRGPIRITYLYDDECLRATQPVDYIPVPDCPVFPRIVVQAIDNGGRDNGPAWTWVEELDHGRGSWVTYDERIHDVPKSSAALPDVGTESRSVDLSASAEVELEADTAPMSAPPSVEDEDEVEDAIDEVEDDDEDDEPSELFDDEEDEEDDVTAE